MSALEPGLYRATVRGVADQIVMVTESDYTYNCITMEAVLTQHTHHPKAITDARPLIVLDIHTWFPHRAAAAIEALQGTSLGIGHDVFLTDVLEQITAQEKPARIPEPGLWGVVSAGYAKHLTESGSTYEFAKHGRHWISRSFPQLAIPWADLTDPVLIREGVTE